jgi:hypothetical protein
MLKPFNKNSLVNKYQNLISQINTLENDLKSFERIRAKSFQESNMKQIKI